MRSQHEKNSDLTFINRLDHPWERFSHPDDIGTLLSRYVRHPARTYTVKEILNKFSFTDSPSSEEKMWEIFTDALDSLLIELEYAPCAFFFLEDHPSALSSTKCSKSTISYEIVICNHQDNLFSKWYYFVTISDLTKDEKDKIIDILDSQFQLTEKK